MIQIKPNHADHISSYKKEYIEKMLSTETVYAQQKYDGERMLIHFDGPNIYCTSRRISKKTGLYMENQDKLPYLQTFWTNKYKELQEKNIDIGYTVLDCECYAKNWSEIVGILHSLPERAKSLQTHTTVKYAVFDCLFINGKDLRNESYEKRYMQLKNVLSTLKYSQFELVCNYWTSNYDEVMAVKDYFISKGCEGIVLKSFSKTYYQDAASIKCKKFETVDVVVYDYIQGNGKYSSTVGALLVGYYDSEHDKIIHISRVNCGTDYDRNEWRDNWQQLKNCVIEVKCQEITNKSLRHPVYIRKRLDKSYKICTKDTIFK